MLNKKQKIVYLKLIGRIGNQLFQYSFAKKICDEIGDNCILIIDDSINVKHKYKNSLKCFDLNNVIFTSDIRFLLNIRMIRFFIVRNIWHLFTRFFDFENRFKIENKFQTVLNKLGMIMFETGYIEYSLYSCNEYYIEGYFQSKKLIKNSISHIKQLFSDKHSKKIIDYNNYYEIINNNTICLSLKYEDNVGSSLFQVCDKNYWLRAIEYIKRHIQNPFFFICSDNVDYVINYIINGLDIEYCIQDKSFSVEETLYMMSLSKHFIIGNTTYAWWAQEMSDNVNKIVIAPKKWMNDDKIPCDIYNDDWVLL